ncbi:MAG: hypothetical protein JJV99_08910 [Colwellia sp.]|nr:hypothetical protein [Colwellia sp.]
MQCGCCFAACEDTSHQAILKTGDVENREYTVIDDECVGCNVLIHAMLEASESMKAKV